MKKMNLLDNNARMHLIGRLWLGAGMILICTIPLWLALYYDVEPDWSVFGTAAVISPFILMALSGVAEPIIYSPMVGVNGMYLSFLTGNLSNLKVPCALNAMQACGVCYRNASSTMPDCADAAEVAANYGTNAARALYFGFMTLDAAGRFDPKRLVSRGEGAVILDRVADFAGL